MCVIVVVPQQGRVEKDVLRRCEQANPDGIGVAWTTADGGAAWRKGIRLDEAVELVEKHSPHSVVAIHFRRASVGEKSPSLCHPFPISRRVTVALEGQARRVLMHNGHESDWAKLAFEFASANQVAPPRGPWSDSRAIAWCVWHDGEAILKKLSGSRFAVLGNHEARLYGTWEERYNVKFSNLYWDSSRARYFTRWGSEYLPIRYRVGRDGFLETCEYDGGDE